MRYELLSWQHERRSADDKRISLRTELIVDMDAVVFSAVCSRNVTRRYLHENTEQK